MKTIRKGKHKGSRPRGKPPGATYADVLAEERAQKAAAETAVADRALALMINVQVRRMMWLMVCSMADAYGIGPKRAEKFFEALQANSEELERMRVKNDDDYAWDKLRLRAQQVTGVDLRDISTFGMEGGEAK